MNAKNTVLVVGAGGFLGSHVQLLLKQQGVPVLSTTSRSRQAAEPGWVYLDVTRPETFCNLPETVHSIIYLAQSPHYRDFPEQAEHLWGVNVQGVFRLLEYARTSGAVRFILASSGSVYAPSLAPLTESSPLATGDSQSFYIMTKLAAESVANTYNTFFAVTTLRFFTLYGPRLSSSMLMARLIQRIADGEPVTLDGEDGFIFNPIFVTDAAQAISSSLALVGANTINVAGPQAYSLGDICREIGQQVGRPPIFVQGKSGWQIEAETEMMHQLLTVSATTLTEGLQRHISWWKARY